MEPSSKARTRIPSRRAVEAMDVDVDQFFNLTPIEPPSASPSSQLARPSYPTPGSSTTPVKRRKKQNGDISTPVSALPPFPPQAPNSPKKRKRKDSDAGGSPLAAKRVAKSGGRKNAVADNNVETEPSTAASVAKKPRNKQFLRLETPDEPLPPLGPLSPPPRLAHPLADILSDLPEPPPDHLPLWSISFAANEGASSNLCAYRCGGNVESDLLSRLSCDPSSPDTLLRQGECNLGLLFDYCLHPTWKYAVYSLYPSIPAEPSTSPVVDAPSSSSDPMGASSSSSNSLPLSLETPTLSPVPQLYSATFPSVCVVKSAASPAPLQHGYLISASSFARSRPSLSPSLLATFFSLHSPSNASHYLIVSQNA